MEIKKKYFFFLVLTTLTLATTVMADDSFYDLSPRPTQIDGKFYPRNSLIQYRGTSDHQMNLEKALKAMLGDDSAFTESLFFSTIKQAFMKKHFAKSIALNSFLDDLIKEKISANGGAFDEREASQETKKLVDGTFQYLKSKDQLVDRYVSYTSGNFIDWPQDVVFTTVISPVAATYGDRILVVKEKIPRALDLNFWNKVNNDLWFHYTRDAGEMISFGYLNPEDLIGYQIRSGSEKSWHSIETAFYKSGTDKNPAVLVLSGIKKDGYKSTCLDFDSRNEVYHCDYRPGRAAMEPPSLTREKPELLGVIVLCQSEKKCDPVPLAELKKYSTSSASANLNLENIKVKNKQVRFIRATDLLKHQESL